jgi:hypothetical protein
LDQTPNVTIDSPQESASLPAQEPLGTPVNEKKGARAVFNAFNYLGLNWIGNSTLSLLITYAVLPTNLAQGVKKLGGELLKPAVVFWDKAKGLVGKAELEGLSNEARELRLKGSARSATEILCMVAAGFIVLPFIKAMEDHKEWWINKIDGWLHPSKKHEHKEPLPETKKETWGNLIKSRLIALGIIFGIDHQIQVFNNKRLEKGLGNVDTVEWGLGTKLFKALPDSVRDRIVKIFSPSKGVSIESIQPDMQERLLLHVNGHHPELQAMTKRLGQLHQQIHENPKLDEIQWWQWKKRRSIIEELGEAVKPEREQLLEKINKNPEFKKTIEHAMFAEQTRLLSKEVSMTLIYTGLLFAFAKMKVFSRLMEKCGLKPKREEHAVPPAAAAAAPFGDSYEPQEAAKPGHSERIAPREKAVSEPKSRFTQRLAAEPDASIQPSL